MQSYFKLLIIFLLFSITSAESATSTKAYKLPKEGIKVKIAEANFSIFPESLNFSPEKNIFIVSRKWQTACLYDKTGKLYYKQNKPVCVQAGTGKKDFPTELGLYNIQTKYDAKYKSTFYTTSGNKPKKPTEGAPMPYAMHIGRIIGLSPEKKFWYEFSDGTAIHEKQTITKVGAYPFVSHGCIAVEKDFARELQNLLNYGDLVLLINEKIPTNIVDMISINN